MGQEVRRGAEDRGGGGRALGGARGAGRGARGRLAALVALFLVFALALRGAEAQAHPAPRAPRPVLSSGRFTISFTPRDRQLAESMLRSAAARDTYPGLPRPREQVSIAVAADRADFRDLIGPYAPEWGAAIAVPSERRIVMQGQRAGSDAGDPIEVLRHELAHLALHEALGDLPPRWFDEGYASYAAAEWSREDALAANLALAVRGVPTFDELEDAFMGGSMEAQQAYALAYRAVAELAALDPQFGLSRFFVEWKRAGAMDAAVRAAYGITLGGFEAHWQRRTRRRYGLVALAADVTVATLVTLLVVLPLYVARRRRDRRRMAALVEADRAAALEDRDGALAIMLGDGWDEPSRGAADVETGQDRAPDEGGRGRSTGGRSPDT